MLKIKEVVTTEYGVLVTFEDGKSVRLSPHEDRLFLSFCNCVIEPSKEAANTMSVFWGKS